MKNKVEVGEKERKEKDVVDKWETRNEEDKKVNGENK